MKRYYEGLACRLLVFLKEWTFQISWHCHFWLHKERSSNETNVEWCSSHPNSIHFNYAFRKCSQFIQIVQTVAVLRYKSKRVIARIYDDDYQSEFLYLNVFLGLDSCSVMSKHSTITLSLAAKGGWLHHGIMNIPLDEMSVQY